MGNWSLNETPVLTNSPVKIKNRLVCTSVGAAELVTRWRPPFFIYLFTYFKKIKNNLINSPFQVVRWTTRRSNVGRWWSATRRSTTCACSGGYWFSFLISRHRLARTPRPCGKARHRRCHWACVYSLYDAGVDLYHAKSSHPLTQSGEHRWPSANLSSVGTKRDFQHRPRWLQTHKQTGGIEHRKAEDISEGSGRGADDRDVNWLQEEGWGRSARRDRRSWRWSKAAKWNRRAMEMA